MLMRTDKNAQPKPGLSKPRQGKGHLRKTENIRHQWPYPSQTAQKRICAHTHAAETSQDTETATPAQLLRSPDAPPVQCRRTPRALGVSPPPAGNAPTAVGSGRADGHWGCSPAGSNKELLRLPLKRLRGHAGLVITQQKQEQPTAVLREPSGSRNVQTPTPSSNEARASWGSVEAEGGPVFHLHQTVMRGCPHSCQSSVRGRQLKQI